MRRVAEIVGIGVVYLSPAIGVAVILLTLYAWIAADLIRLIKHDDHHQRSTTRHGQIQ